MCLNEVQFPKELQHLGEEPVIVYTHCLNEVQFPKELQQRRADVDSVILLASMKCSSQRNCNPSTQATLDDC